MSHSLHADASFSRIGLAFSLYFSCGVVDGNIRLVFKTFYDERVVHQSVVCEHGFPQAVHSRSIVAKQDADLLYWSFFRGHV